MKPTLRSFYLFSFFLASLNNLYAQDQAPPSMPMILDEVRSMKESLGENGKCEMPVCEFNLKDVLCRMMTSCPSPSPKLCECAKKLENGSLTLPLCDLLEIMPEVVRFAYEATPETNQQTPPGTDQERAPRPGAPAATANDAVVGKNACDLTQVLGLLSAIKKHIKILQQIICLKFAETWTILADISLSLTCFRDIPISEPTIITEPGSYCLVNDIVGTITILSDCVTLNLNHFKMLGPDRHVEIDGSNGVVVRNGTVRDSATNGIQINNSVDVELQQLNLINNANGVFVTTVTCLKIEDCSFREHTGRVILATTLFDTIIKDSSFKLNTADRIIDINNGHNIVFNSLAINNNLGGPFVGIFVLESCNLVFDNTSVNENNAVNTLNGIELINVRSAKFTNCEVLKNTASENLNGINVAGLDGNSFDITIHKCEVSQNVSQRTVNGIFGNGVVKQVISKTQANNNVGVDGARGFNLEFGTDNIYQHCFALTNSALALASGFRSNASLKTIYEECIANDNIASNTAIGFELLNTNTSCVLGCIAKRNNGTNDTGRGILLLDCLDNIVQDNLAVSNFGFLTGIGIEVSNTGGAGILSTGVFGNKSQAHTLNFRVSPGMIFRVLYNRAAALVMASAVPTILDNLDIT